MEILQVAVNKLKCRFSEMIEEEYIVENYGIKSCTNHFLKPFDNIKLELIFLSNIEYICLSEDQLRKIKSGNYKNLFFKKPNFEVREVDLINPVIITSSCCQ